MRSVRLFAYETYMLQHRRSFVKTKDTERNLLITLAAGRGVILDAYVQDEAATKITKAAPGTKLTAKITVKNEGDSDYIWFTVKDKDTGALIFQPTGENFMAKGTTWVYTRRDLTMPNKNWNWLIEAGHGR